jgi:hypothetical protein
MNMKTLLINSIRLLVSVFVLNLVLAQKAFGSPTSNNRSENLHDNQATTVGERERERSPYRVTQVEVGEMSTTPQREFSTIDHIVAFHSALLQFSNDSNPDIRASVITNLENRGMADARKQITSACHWTEGSGSESSFYNIDEAASPGTEENTRMQAGISDDVTAVDCLVDTKYEEITETLQGKDPAEKIDYLADNLAICARGIQDFWNTHGLGNTNQT